MGEKKRSSLDHAAQPDCRALAVTGPQSNYPSQRKPIRITSYSNITLPSVLWVPLPALPPHSQKIIITKQERNEKDVVRWNAWN